ncbi:MAG TPA: hypothetical protein VIY30_14420, partial [Burkholderiaceae bacterium]
IGRVHVLQRLEGDAMSGHEPPALWWVGAIVSVLAFKNFLSALLRAVVHDHRRRAMRAHAGLSECGRLAATRG